MLPAATGGAPPTTATSATLATVARADRGLPWRRAVLEAATSRFPRPRRAARALFLAAARMVTAAWAVMRAPAATRRPVARETRHRPPAQAAEPGATKSSHLMTAPAGRAGSPTRAAWPHPIRAMLHPQQVRLVGRAVPLGSEILGSRAGVVGPRPAAARFPTVPATPCPRQWRAVGQAEIRQIRMDSPEAAAARARQAWLLPRRARARRHRARAHPAATAAVRTPAVQEATALLPARQGLVGQVPQLHRRALAAATEASEGKSISVPAERVAGPQPPALRKADWAARHHPRTLTEGREVPAEEGTVNSGATAAGGA